MINKKKVMVPGDFKIVTLLVIMFFSLPVFWNIYKLNTFIKFSFNKLIQTLNKSLVFQGAILIIGIPIAYLLNKFDFILNEELVGAIYSYIVIAIYMYLPILGLFNIINYIYKKKNSKFNY